MASIQRIVSPLTGEVAYRVQVRRKGRPPDSARFPNREEAVAWAESLERGGAVEEFTLGPATLEDVYVALVGGTRPAHLEEALDADAA